MSIISILSEVQDSRKGSSICKFNGFLEDYLNSESSIRPEIKEVFQSLLETYPDFRVMSDLRFNVNKQAISNQIIRYKDVAKLPANYYDVAYIVYGEVNGQETGLMIMDGDRHIDYLLAKAMYYCLTEQYALLENCRYEVLVMTMGHLAEVKGILETLSEGKTRFSVLQRRLDKVHYNGFYELQAQVMEHAQWLYDHVEEELNAVADRSIVIFRNIATWFLCKKILYVQYMMNKDFLQGQCEGSVKKQRSMAKEIVDQVPYISFSEMWRMKEAD